MKSLGPLDVTNKNQNKTENKNFRHRERFIYTNRMCIFILIVQVFYAAPGAGCSAVRAAVGPEKDHRQSPGVAAAVGAAAGPVSGSVRTWTEPERAVRSMVRVAGEPAADDRLPPVATVRAVRAARMSRPSSRAAVSPLKTDEEAKKHLGFTWEGRFYVSLSCPSDCTAGEGHREGVLRQES